MSSWGDSNSMHLGSMLQTILATSVRITEGIRLDAQARRDLSQFNEEQQQQQQLRWPTICERCSEADRLEGSDYCIACNYYYQRIIGDGLEVLRPCACCGKHFLLSQLAHNQDCLDRKIFCQECRPAFPHTPRTDAYYWLTQARRSYAQVYGALDWPKRKSLVVKPPQAGGGAGSKSYFIIPCLVIQESPPGSLEPTMIEIQPSSPLPYTPKYCAVLYDYTIYGIDSTHQLERYLMVGYKAEIIDDEGVMYE